MSGGTLVITLLMLVIGIAWLALPFIRQRRAARSQNHEKAGEAARLIAAYERTLMSVRDLDEDYQVGKLSETLYTTERTQWMEQGAALLEALEKIGGQKPTIAPPKKPVTDDPVEAAIAAYSRAREQMR